MGSITKKPKLPENRCQKKYQKTPWRDICHSMI